MTEQRREKELVIIGGGPAGLTAAIYAARAGLDVTVLEKQFPGGQIATTDRVENYPGFPQGVGGFELGELMKSQAESFGAKIETEEALAIEGDAAKGRKIIKTASGSTISALAAIVATGARYRRLGVPGEEKFWGKGVSVCATCDAALYRDKHVVVVGGGDTAIQESLFLVKFVRKLTLVHRRDRLRAEKALQDRILAVGPQVEFRWDTVVTGIIGDDLVAGVAVKNVKTGEAGTIDCDGTFILIGFVPNSEFVRDFVEMDEHGSIITNDALMTSVEGVFACGDVRKGALRQVVSACGEGAMAAVAAQHYIDDKKGTAYP